MLSNAFEIADDIIWYFARFVWYPTMDTERGGF
jgi:hypothetical protein